MHLQGSCEQLMQRVRDAAEQDGAEGALELANDAVEQCPGQSASWRLRGSLHLSLMQDQSLRDFERALTLEPDCAPC